MHLNPCFDEEPNPNQNKEIQMQGKISVDWVFCNSEDKFSFDEL